MSWPIRGERLIHESSSLAMGRSSLAMGLGDVANVSKRSSFCRAHTSSRRAKIAALSPEAVNIATVKYSVQKEAKQHVQMRQPFESGSSFRPSLAMSCSITICRDVMHNAAPYRLLLLNSDACKRIDSLNTGRGETWLCVMCFCPRRVAPCVDNGIQCRIVSHCSHGVATRSSGLGARFWSALSPNSFANTPNRPL